MKNYTALIIDIKKSRSYSINDRTSIQNFIIEVIDQLNSIFRSAISREVEFSAGDEVQGLFSSPEAALLFFRLFYMLIFPVEVRAGIGVGEWSIKVKNASTTAQDGPVYHSARRAINEVSDTIGYSVLFNSGNDNDFFINSAINTPFILSSNHSEYQNELMLLFEFLYPIDYNKIIDTRNLHQLTKLITTKNMINYYLRQKRGNSVKKYHFAKIGLLDISVNPIDAISDDSTFYVASGRKRGLASELANILEISRQSIEKTIKAANILAVRNSTIVALKLMDKFI